jgi:hypothetical protein
MQRADIRVAQPGDRPGFAFESAAVFRILAAVRQHHLDGDHTIEARVAGSVHLTHSPGAKQRDDLVGPQPSADGQHHLE